jgi:hypothetical protein
VCDGAADRFTVISASPSLRTPPRRVRRSSGVQIEGDNHELALPRVASSASGSGIGLVKAVGWLLVLDQAIVRVVAPAYCVLRTIQRNHAEFDIWLKEFCARLIQGSYP